MTQRSIFSTTCAVMIGAIGLSATVGLVYLALADRSIPTALTNVAIGAMMALAGALSLPPNTQASTNGTTKSGPPDPADGLRAGR